MRNQIARGTVGAVSRRFCIGLLSLEDVREAPVFLPPLAEQAAVVAYITAEAEKFDVLCVQAQLSKELLQERRSALISAAVTGKIDVRDWQPVAA